jgi:hypothetical protein
MDDEGGICLTSCSLLLEACILELEVEGIAIDSRFDSPTVCLWISAGELAHQQEGGVELWRIVSGLSPPALSEMLKTPCGQRSLLIAMVMVHKNCYNGYDSRFE